MECWELFSLHSQSRVAPRAARCVASGLIFETEVQRLNQALAADDATVKALDARINAALRDLGAARSYAQKRHCQPWNLA